MILQALNDYYLRCQRSPDPRDRLPAFGLEEKEIPFVIDINGEGRLVNLADTRTIMGKKRWANVFSCLKGERRPLA
jgi:CRISPR-associated protein Csd1